MRVVTGYGWDIAEGCEEGKQATGDVLSAWRRQEGFTLTTKKRPGPPFRPPFQVHSTNHVLHPKERSDATSPISPLLAEGRRRTAVAFDRNGMPSVQSVAESKDQVICRFQ